MGFVSTLNGIADQLRAGGVAAATDRRDLNPPAVLVTPETLLSPTKLCGRGRLRAVLELIVADTGDGPALVQLEGLYDRTVPVIASVITTDDRDFTRSNTTDSPDTLPSIRLTVETPIT